MKSRIFRILNAAFIISVAFFLFCPSIINAGDADQAAYDSFKGAYDSFKGVFKGTKDKVDGATDFFGNFNGNMSQWRKACSKDMQDQAIENIQDMTKEQLGAIDSLAEKLKEMTGVDIPESIPEGIKSKLSAKILSSLTADQAKKYGYMYTLSSYDRKLRDNGVYEKLGSLKEQFDAGEALLGNIDKVVEFTDTFNPNGDGTPTNSLKKIKGVLDYMGGFTEEFPLIGKIIKGYAEATDHFVAALDDLDKKLKDSRQGSLGGQIGVDKPIKDKIFAECPAVGADEGLTWFSNNGEHPALAPIRGWADKDVVLYYGSASGDGVVAYINGASFEILYKYYVALKNSASADNKKLATPEAFINAAKAVGTKDLSANDKKFRDDYKLFDGSGNYDFINVLKIAGRVNDDNYLVSESGRVMEYRIYMQQEEEFCGLCYFNHQFRNDEQAIRYKYYGEMAVTGDIKTKPDSPKLGNITVNIDSNPALQFKRKGDNEVTYGHVIHKDKPYSVYIDAKGFQPISKSEVKETNLTFELQPTYEGMAQARIVGPDSCTVETPATYTIEFDSTTEMADKLKERWAADTITVEGKTFTYNPTRVGPNTIYCTVTSPDGMVSKGVFQKNINVSNVKGDYGITLTVPARTIVGPSQNFLIAGKITATKKIYFSSLSTTVKDETTGKMLRNDSWFGPDNLKYNSEVNVSFAAPAAAGEYALTFTLKGKSDNNDVIISTQKAVYVVPTATINCPDNVNATDIFDVSANVPGEMPAAVASYNWSPYDSIISGSEWGKTTTSSVKMQIRNDQIGAGNKVDIVC